MCKTIGVRITWEWDNGKGNTIPSQEDIEVVLSPTDPTFIKYACIIDGGEDELSRYIDVEHRNEQFDTSYVVKNAKIEAQLENIQIDPKQCKMEPLKGCGKSCGEKCIIIMFGIPTENGDILEFPIGRICIVEHGENHIVVKIFAAGQSLYPIVVLAYLQTIPDGECLTFSEKLWNHYPSLAAKLKISRSLDENNQGVYVLTNKLL